ncbi:MAG: hypothetical protein M1820_004240 [Bogoriella megaspora]|nr:MAG: hypothetical protein M1820_004240 [Bogoriella megaspora]
MSGSSQWDGKIQPAHLAFLAIYNPELGPTDETFQDQIVFYYSHNAHQFHNSKNREVQYESALQEQENEKLRQIGLAQGMVHFAQGFSSGESVDSIETEKSRIILYELEKGWWILASIALTRIPTNNTTYQGTSTSEANEQPKTIEYSSREVSPPQLLIGTLKRAFTIFLLHHGPSLSSLYDRLSRPKFCNTLERFWMQFAQNWEVLLHGNPTIDVFNGLKLAAGGELGFGVGEEDWGSGEREVLEDLVGRTEGLVDLIVSRFGEPLTSHGTGLPATEKYKKRNKSWIGRGHIPEAADGVIFGGIGNLTRSSIRDIAGWIANIYQDGEFAYGVSQNPHSDRRRRRRRKNDSSVEAKIPANRKEDSQIAIRAEDFNGATKSTQGIGLDQMSTSPGIPPPIVSAAESSLNNAIKSVDKHQNAGTELESTGTVRKRPTLLPSDSWMKVLTLGYMGSPASTKMEESRDSGKVETSAPKSANEQDVEPLRQVDPTPVGASKEHERLLREQQESTGYYLVGLRGDLDSSSELEGSGTEDEDGIGNRLLLRTIHASIVKDESYTEEVDKVLSRNTSYSTTDSSLQATDDGVKRLRVVIYAHRPFIYAFLFDPRTDSLSIPSFYRSLSQHLRPLHKPLCRNTSPANVYARIASAQQGVSKTTSAAAPNNQQILDLVYDPGLLTVHTSIPNIPEPGTLAANGISSPESTSDVALYGQNGWSRIEALNVHTQILNMISTVQYRQREIERTCKTSRGWWVVWMRLPPSGSTPKVGESTHTRDHSARDCRQAFLVRKASDSQAPTSNATSRNTSGGIFSLRSPSWAIGGGASTWGPGRLTDGIGVDARKYVEGLLSLNR